MNELSDIDGNESLIRGYIQRYGFMPEHNFDYFKCLVDEGEPRFVYEDNFGVLCFVGMEGKHRIVKTLVEPLSTDPDEALEKFLHYFLEEKKYDKAVLETRYDTKLALAKRLNGKGFRLLKERYSLTWPVFFMQNFDENLIGGKWKKIRYFKNKFFKENNAVIVDFRIEDKEGLKALILSWAMKRTAHDRVHYKKYLSFIESGFKGFDMVKVIKLDGKPVSIFGGWRIPNSNNYYSCVGIFDYDIDNLGEVSNVLDLSFIKRMGFEKADLGGGEESLTDFKRKFFPDEFYRTDVYTVEKRI